MYDNITIIRTLVGIRFHVQFIYSGSAGNMKVLWNGKIRKENGLNEEIREEFFFVFFMNKEKTRFIAEYKDQIYEWRKNKTHERMKD